MSEDLLKQILEKLDQMLLDQQDFRNEMTGFRAEMNTRFDRLDDATKLWKLAATRNDT